MLNKEKHRLIMVQILKDIYNDIEISSLLGLVRCNVFESNASNIVFSS